MILKIILHLRNCFSKKKSKTIKSYIFIKDTRLSNGNALFFHFPELYALKDVFKDLKQKQKWKLFQANNKAHYQ